MSYYCDICDRRIKYLDTPLYKALFKCLINEYREFLELEKVFIKYINLHSETGVYSIPFICRCELSYLKQMLFSKILINHLPMFL